MGKHIYATLLLDCQLGFNNGCVCWVCHGSKNVANSFGTSVASKVLSIMQASILAGIFNFIGAIVFGGEVTDTIRHKNVSLELFESIPHLYMATMLSAYFGTFGLVMSATCLNAG